MKTTLACFFVPACLIPRQGTSVVRASRYLRILIYKKAILEHAAPFLFPDILDKQFFSSPSHFGWLTAYMIGLNMEAVLAAMEGICAFVAQKKGTFSKQQKRAEGFFLDVKVVTCVTRGVSRCAPPNWPITAMKA